MTRAYVLLLLILVLAACSKGRADLPAVAAQKPADGQPTVSMQERMAVQEERVRTIADRGFGPLVHGAEPTSSNTVWISQLRSGDPKALHQAAFGNAHLGVWRASGHFQAATRSLSVPEISELAPFCFIWLARTPGSSEPALLRDPAVLIRREPQSLETLQIEGLALGLTRRDSRLFIVRPDFLDESDLRVSYFEDEILPPTAGLVDSADMTARPDRGPVVEDWFTGSQATDEVRRWDYLNVVLPQKADMTDTRYFNAYEDLRDLVAASVGSTHQLPRSLEELQRTTGLTTINLVPASESDADLVLGFDDVQAYRFWLRFPSGITFDTVMYWYQLGAQGSARLHSYAEFQREVGRPFRTIGAWDLVLATEAELPGGLSRAGEG